MTKQYQTMQTMLWFDCGFVPFSNFIFCAFLKFHNSKVTWYKGISICHIQSSGLQFRNCYGFQKQNFQIHCNLFRSSCPVVVAMQSIVCIIDQCCSHCSLVFKSILAYCNVHCISFELLSNFAVFAMVLLSYLFLFF